MATQEELERIIQESIDSSDGSFYMEWGEGYDNLTLDEQRFVEDKVYEVISNCDCCGWHFNYENLESVSSGQEMCWNCAANYDEEDESDED